MSHRSFKNAWFRVQDDTTQNVTIIDASIPSPSLPSGLNVFEFLSSAEASELVDEIDNHPWNQDGFHSKKRVQHYSAPFAEFWEKAIQRLMERLPDGYESCRPKEIIVEERFPYSYTGHKCNTFEYDRTNHSTICSCLDEIPAAQCTCYTAAVTLLNPCIQALDRPTERKVDCWDMLSVNHDYNILMAPNTIYIKTGEAVWNWRRRIMSTTITTSYSKWSSQTDTLTDLLQQEQEEQNLTSQELIPNQDNQRILTIHFRHCHDIQRSIVNTISRKQHISNHVSSSSTHYSQEDNTGADQRPLAELLTILVTTSPIKSNPSTEVVEKTFDTFAMGGHDFAYKCEKIIICDGCRIKIDNDDHEHSNGNHHLVTNKYKNVKQALRNGIANPQQAERYKQFKQGLANLCCDAKDDPSHSFHNTRIVELEERHGYGFALRHALLHEIKTPYVCVIQHDRTFMRKTPMEEVVRCMTNKRNGNIKYVGINMRSNLIYRDIFLSKFGKNASKDMLDHMIILPPELNLDASMYGPNSVSVDDFVECSDILKANMVSLAENYKDTLQMTSHLKMMEAKRDDVHSPNDKHQLSLTPTLYWYDNTHIVETAHYRDYIFDPKKRMVVRGGFVEDKLSPVILKSVEKLGLIEGHDKFGSYILDDHSGYYFTGHLDGGSYMVSHDKLQEIEKSLKKSSKVSLQDQSETS